MKIAVILPRGMHFGPKRATAIDLCVRDFVTFSRFRDTTAIFGEFVGRAILRPLVSRCFEDK